MNLKKALIFSLFTLPLLVISQEFQQFNSNAESASLNYKIDPENSNVSGSPYIQSEWVNGKVEYLDGSIVEAEEMNYNVLKNEITFKKENKNYLVPHKKIIKKIYLDQLELNGYEYEGDYYFFEVLVEGEINLLKKHIKRIVKGTPSKGYIASTPDKIIDSNIILAEKNSHISEVKLKKKSNIIELMKDSDVEIRTYLSEKKLNLKQLQDLIELTNYYNSLK